MAPTRLDQLPHELITHIATSCTATSALQLSATCQIIRDVCHNGWVYKAILLASVNEPAHPEDTALDIAAIARRCASDAIPWARYAVASERAQTILPSDESNSNNGPNNVARSWSKWLPELFLVRHPAIETFDWANVVRSGPDEHIESSPNNKLEWCITVATLARREPDNNEGAPNSIISIRRGVSHVQGLCYSIKHLRRMLAGIAPRMNSLPQSYIPIPSIESIDLCSSGPYDTLPLPFAPGIGSWNRWHKQRHHDMVQDITTGTWQGYYCYMTFNRRRLDESMRDIKFTAPDVERPSHVVAKECFDGLGGFSVEGDIIDEEDQGVTFSATKRYGIGGHSWGWDLKLTSFGLIGFWGHEPNTASGRHGSVWLWKKA